MGFLKIQLVAKYQKNEGGPFEHIEKLPKNSLAKPKKGAGKSLSAEKLERGTRLLCYGFVFHVIGFRCVQNQVLSTFDKNPQCTKSGTYRVSSSDEKKRKNTSHSNSRTLH